MRCLITQTWKLTLDRFPAEITIPLPPCQSVDRVFYLDGDGQEVEIDAADYRLVAAEALPRWASTVHR